MDGGVERGGQTFKRNKPAENDYITISRIFIYIRYNDYAFSTAAVLIAKRDCYVTRQVKYL